MLLGRVLTVFSLMPAREDFLGNLVFSSYYKDASPVRIASRVFSFVDSVSASLTRCKTRAAFPRGKNRLVELGARAGITVLAAPAPTWNNSQWAGKCAVICSPPSNGLGVGSARRNRAVGYQTHSRVRCPQRTVVAYFDTNWWALAQFRVPHSALRI